MQKKRMKSVLSRDGSTDFNASLVTSSIRLKTDAVKWADSPLGAKAA
jgi:hypothetical protein